MNFARERLEIYWLALRMLLLWSWVRLRLLLRVRTSRRLWRTWYDLLSRLTEKIFGELRFMNYGYLPLDAPVPSDGDEDAYQVNLVRCAANAGERTPVGERVLEVGCGRGGGAAWMARNLGARNVTAIDLSHENIRACRHAFGGLPDLTFEVGDAESMPFDDEVFDRIVNVESSHCYPHFPKFLAEGHRVLRTGGTLCIVDFRLAERFAAWRHDIETGPLELLERTDITDDVLRALEADHDRKVSTIASSGAPAFMHRMLQQFTGCRGSEVHRSLEEGRRRYWKFVLRRRA